MNQKTTVHLINDRSSEARIISDVLNSSGSELEISECLPDTLSHDVACLVVRMDTVDQSLTIIRALRRQRFPGAIVFFSSSDSVEVLDAVLAAGAQDVLLPNVDTPRLIRRAIRHAIARQQSQPAPGKPLDWIQDRFMEAQALARVGSWEVDIPSWTVEWSPEFRRIVGIPPNCSPLGVQEYGVHVHPADRSRVTAELLGLFQHGHRFESEHRIVHSDGEEIHVLAIGRCDLSTDGRVLRAYGTTQDITARKKLETELAELSLRDDLTRLRNRRGFVTLAEQQLRIAERSWKNLAVFFIDVNEMKPINDSFGHETGNIALRDTAALLANTFRLSDIVARIGGDEFAALVTDISFEAAETISNRLQTEFQIFNSTQNRPFVLSISIGFTIYNPAQPKTVELLLADADAEMYQAKRRAKQGLLTFSASRE